MGDGFGWCRIKERFASRQRLIGEGASRTSEAAFMAERIDFSRSACETMLWSAAPIRADASVTSTKMTNSPARRSYKATSSPFVKLCFVGRSRGSVRQMKSESDR